MADKIETDFLQQVKAKSRDALNWFKKLVKQTQRAAFPASTSRKDLKAQSVDMSAKDGVATCLMILEVKNLTELDALKKKIVDSINPIKIERV